MIFCNGFHEGKKFPPLNPLHVFVARLGTVSFTRAAEELNVGQSCRQPANRRAWKAISAFRSISSGAFGLTLTPDGVAYFRSVAPGVSDNSRTLPPASANGRAPNR